MAESKSHPTNEVYHPPARRFSYYPRCSSFAKRPCWTGVDVAFNPNANGSVHSVAVQADGRILLGGNFTSMGGIPRSYIARLDAMGELETGFNPSANGIVYSVGVQADGTILFGGAFNMVGGIARTHLARLDATGVLDTGFNSNVGGTVNHRLHCVTYFSCPAPPATPASWTNKRQLPADRGQQSTIRHDAILISTDWMRRPPIKSWINSPQPRRQNINKN